LLDHSSCQRHTKDGHILGREEKGSSGGGRKSFTVSWLGIEKDILFDFWFTFLNYWVHFSDYLSLIAQLVIRLWDLP